LQDRRAGGFGFGDARETLAHIEIHEQVAEVDVAHQEPDWRHDDVVDERCDDPAERGADDDADGEIDYVAAHRELFELF